MTPAPPPPRPSGLPRPSGFYVARISGQWVASYAYRGSATEVGKGFDYLLNWAAVYHVEPWGPLVGVYADGTGGPDRELEAELWLPLPPGKEEAENSDGRVRVKWVPEVTVAATLYRGFPDGLGGRLRELLEWLEHRALVRTTSDHRQVYRAAPPGCPSDWEVEIQVPAREEGS